MANEDALFSEPQTPNFELQTPNPEGIYHRGAEQRSRNQIVLVLEARWHQLDRV
jgi:hypothetical protein